MKCFINQIEYQTPTFLLNLLNHRICYKYIFFYFTINSYLLGYMNFYSSSDSKNEIISEIRAIFMIKFDTIRKYYFYYLLIFIFYILHVNKQHKWDLSIVFKVQKWEQEKKVYFRYYKEIIPINVCLKPFISLNCILISSIILTKVFLNIFSILFRQIFQLVAETNTFSLI